MEESFLESITILIVDDNENDAQILSDTLGRYFKKIYTAVDGEEAYEYFKANKDIDIIVSDFNMPKIDGLQLLRLVRLSDLYLPFILTSGNFEIEFLIKAINLNVSSFLPKPISIKDLLEKIDILCEKKLFEQRVKTKQDEINNYLASVDRVAIILKMNGKGDIIYMNDAMLEVSGYSKEEIKDLNIDNIIHPNIPRKYTQLSWEKVKAGELWKGTTKYIDKKNEVFYLNHTVFKLDSKEDEFISIAFLATQESIEKRNFHKKLITTFKDYNIREHEYKTKLEKLEKSLELCNRKLNQDNTDIVANLKYKIKKQEAQIRKYESKLEASEAKYDNMLHQKKEELERYVNLIQIEKTQADKYKEENHYLKKSYKKLKTEFDTNKEDNIKMYKRIIDLQEIIRNNEE